MNRCDVWVRPIYIVWLGAALLSAGALGCSKRPNREPPKTYPVSGQIVQTGGRNVAGTMIQFDPENIEYRSQGIIGPDNRFTLQLLFGSERLEGAIEGKHKVTIYYQPDRIAANKGSATVSPEQPCDVRPGENHFEIKLPPL